MIFLAYLSIRNTQVHKLPRETKELRILRTLDVSYTQISELPLELFELTDLWHLDPVADPEIFSSLGEYNN
jgi:Leucine-rich repeat (LRR) protein